MCAKIVRFKQLGQRMPQENDALPRATEPPCQYFMRRTTQQNFFTYFFGEFTENNEALIFF